MSTHDLTPTPPTRLWVSGVCLIVFGLGLAASALGPIDTMTVLVIVAVIVFALGWGRLVHAPSPQTSGIIVALAALSGIIAVRVTMDAFWCALIAAFVVFFAFLGEIARGQQRTSVLGSLATTVTGSVLALSAVSWVALENYRMWLILAHPMGICLAVAGLCFFLRGSVWARAGVSVLACTLGGLVSVGVVMALGLGGEESVLAASASVGASEPLIAMFVVFGAFGLIEGLVVAGCHAFFSGRIAPTSTLGAMALGMIPWLSAAIPVYTFARIVSG